MVRFTAQAHVCFTVLGILVFSGVLLLPALLPIAGTDDALRSANMNNKRAGNYSELEKIAMGNGQFLVTVHVSRANEQPLEKTLAFASGLEDNIIIAEDLAS